MPGPLSSVAVSPRAKRRLRLFSVAVLAVVAALSWWSIIEDGASAARLLTALATSLAAVLQVFVPRTRRTRRRARAAAGPM